MAGKSTYMRQSCADRPDGADWKHLFRQNPPTLELWTGFLREWGLQMTLQAGRVPFMVEMTEVANILRNATA